MTGKLTERSRRKNDRLQPPSPAASPPTETGDAIKPALWSLARLSRQNAPSARLMFANNSSCAGAGTNALPWHIAAKNRDSADRAQWRNENNKRFPSQGSCESRVWDDCKKRQRHNTHRTTHRSFHVANAEDVGPKGTGWLIC